MCTTVWELLAVLQQLVYSNGYFYDHMKVMFPDGEVTEAPT